MKAVVLDGFGGPEVMKIGEVPTPEPGDGQVLMRVMATSVNRADLIQREGHYPPPPGTRPITRSSGCHPLTPGPTVSITPGRTAGGDDSGGQRPSGSRRRKV